MVVHSALTLRKTLRWSEWTQLLDLISQGMKQHDYETTVHQQWCSHLINEHHVLDHIHDGFRQWYPYTLPTEAQTISPVELSKNIFEWLGHLRSTISLFRSHSMSLDTQHLLDKIYVHMGQMVEWITDVQLDAGWDVTTRVTHLSTLNVIFKHSYCQRPEWVMYRRYWFNQYLVIFPKLLTSHQEEEEQFYLFFYLWIKHDEIRDVLLVHMKELTDTMVQTLLGTFNVFLKRRVLWFLQEWTRTHSSSFFVMNSPSLRSTLRMFLQFDTPIKVDILMLLFYAIQTRQSQPSFRAWCWDYMVSPYWVDMVRTQPVTQPIMYQLLQFYVEHHMTKIQSWKINEERCKTEGSSFFFCVWDLYMETKSDDWIKLLATYLPEQPKSSKVIWFQEETFHEQWQTVQPRPTLPWETLKKEMNDFCEFQSFSLSDA